jgi:hypothetical protein
MSVMNSYLLSLQLYQAHTIYADGTMDCNHWCAPGLSEVSQAQHALLPCTSRRPDPLQLQPRQ